MGAPPPAAPASDDGRDVYRVWPCNWTAVRVFVACETQWRQLPSAAGLLQLGLDYTALDVVMRRLHVSDPDGAIFAQVQEMEAAALSAFNEGRR